MLRLCGFLGLIVAFLVMGSFLARAEDKIITIAADEWCPINCAADGKHEGIGVEIARKIYEPLGYTVQYKVMPWDQAIQAVTNGTVDAVVGANAYDNKALIFPKIPLGFVSDSIYTLKDRPLACESLDCLKGLRLGVINDYGYSPALQNFIDKNKHSPGAIHEEFGNEALERNIQKLVKGDIDAIVESSIVMIYTLDQMKLTNTVRFVYAFPYEDIFLGFAPGAKKSRDLADQFDAGMRDLREVGGLDSIYNRYGIVLE